jgi:hypothetical protein
MLRVVLSVLLVVACGTDPESDAEDPNFPGGKSDDSVAPPPGVWGPLVELRDDSDRWPVDKPAGGWWVTGMHANLLADGRVLITGWERRDRDTCGFRGTRRHGVSFLLDPATDLDAPTFHLQPLDERGRDEDVLYCSGHAPLADGRVLYTGGARYVRLGEGPGAEEEYGLDYARVFDPAGGTFTRLGAIMLGGPDGVGPLAWYPTNTRLPDGRILVTAGFTRCCDGKYANLTVQTFDPAAASPWSVLVAHADGRPEIAPGLRDYTHTIALPRPVQAEDAGGRRRDVAMIGYAGNVLLFDSRPGPADGSRFTERPRAWRPGAGTWSSSAALVGTGEILTIGGTSDATAAQRADFYDPLRDAWRSVNTGIGRNNASTVLLPDGRVLVIGGEGAFAGDRRQPQIVDPETGTVETVGPWANDEAIRGYHGFAILLRDGRILLGGGTHASGDIGCERPDVRIWNPPYFAGGPRPVVRGVSAGAVLPTGGAAVRLGDPGTPLRERAGAALLGLGATTHSFDQNGRYVPLDVGRGSDGSILLRSPVDELVAPPGDYLLFLVSAAGVPSHGTPVRVVRGTTDFRRTVVFVKGRTQPGQDMFIRGGIDHDYARVHLGRDCTASNLLCAVPIRHRNHRNGTTTAWKAGDDWLDWYGAETDQTRRSSGMRADGTPADWTTDAWRFGGTRRTVAADGYGEEPLNRWGDDLWMLDVEMDCAQTVDGWFELKTYITNGPGWEGDVSQPGTPYPSRNHFARCGQITRLERGSSAAELLPLP